MRTSIAYLKFYRYLKLTRSVRDARNYVQQMIHQKRRMGN